MFALVTGSTGFLGSHLVERLRTGGHRVRALVYGPYQAGLLEQAGIEIFPGDISSPQSAAAALKDVDVVFHAAALVSNWAPWSQFFAITVRGAENLLQAAVALRVQRFVHISTIRVYDDRFCRRQRTVTEDAPRGKRGFRHFGRYARAKVMAEDAVWRVASRLPVSVIRPAWIYGPRDERILPAIARFLRSANARWPCRTDPCADPVYVTDVADCAIMAALTPGAAGQAYHASPERCISVREFLGALCQALGFEPPDRSVPFALANLAANVSEWWAWLTFRRTAPSYSRAGLAILTQDVRHSPAKAVRDLGWRAKVDLAEGIAATAAWLKERWPELTAPPRASVADHCGGHSARS